MPVPAVVVAAAAAEVVLVGAAVSLLLRTRQGERAVAQAARITAVRERVTIAHGTDGTCRTGGGDERRRERGRRRHGCGGRDRGGSGNRSGSGAAVRAAGRPLGVAARSRTTVDGVLADLDTPRPGFSRTSPTRRGSVERWAIWWTVSGCPRWWSTTPGHPHRPRVTDLDARTVADTYAVNVGGAVTAAAFLLPRMADLGGGSFLATAGMPTPLPTLTTLSLGKAALRALVELLATEWAPRGIGCSTVTVCGPVRPAPTTARTSLPRNISGCTRRR